MGHAFFNNIIFRDIEKFLKGYGYVRNISVKVVPPPTSLDFFWHHPASQVSNPGTFTSVKNLPPSNTSVKTVAPSQVSKLWHLLTFNI